jgi:Ca-activated chloride channel homolog
MSARTRNRLVCAAALAVGLALGMPAYGQSCAVPTASPLPPGSYLPTYIRLNIAGIEVLDKNGKTVVGLAYNNFKIFEDGRPREIALFDRPGQIGATCIGILVDRSAGRQGVLLNSEIGPIQRFLESTVDKNHAAFISAFNDKTIPIAASSNDPVTLNNEVDHLESSKLAGGAALYDAVEQTAKSISSMRGYRILVVISQAGDNESRATAADAIEAALKANTAVYFIQLESSNTNLDTQHPDGFGKEITSSTGGDLFLAKQEADINGAFEAIKETLSSLYLVGCMPSASLTPGLHRLEVRTRRKALRVVAPTRFYVPTLGPTANPQK